MTRAVAGAEAYDDMPFIAADRACRGAGKARAEAYLARALAPDRPDSDPTGSMTSDLEWALRLGSNDPQVLEAVGARHPDPERRAQAARLLVANDRAGGRQIASACAFLLDRGAPLVLHARRFGPWVTGWAASRSAQAPSLVATWGRDARVALETRLDGSLDAAVGIGAWSFGVALDTDDPIRLDATLEAGPAVSRTLYAKPLAPSRRSASGERTRSRARTRLTVVLPLYGDPESLAACLAALSRQAFADLAFVLIDDAAPDPEVARLGREFCRDNGGRYHRNALNAGFAASVNVGLSLCRAGDVLVLNSDVILPDGALGRLARGAHSSHDIGIVAPFSNDAGNTSYPDPMRPGAAVPRSVAAVIDGAASRVNAGRLVDLPSVLGSCLYVTRACLDRVGAFSLAYGRGYFEDVDLCLRALERGLRVVAACDVYVSHLGGRSFRSERYALITQNGSVLDARFPDHETRDAAHDAADPLRRARALIEESLAPKGGVWTVLLGREATARPIMEHRESQLRGNETRPVLRLHWRRSVAGAEVQVRSGGPDGPRSLLFTLDAGGRRRLGDYLATYDIGGIEVFEPEALPVEVRDWLAASKLRVALVIDGHAAIAAASAMRATLEAMGLADVRLRPADEATATGLPALGGPSTGGPAGPLGGGPIFVSDRRTPARPPGARAGAGVRRRPPRPGHAVRRLGVLMPSLSVPAERLILTLGRCLSACGGPQLFVLGRCIDEQPILATGSAWVTGPLTSAELPVAVSSHDVDALLLPYRDGLRWVLDVAAPGRTLPCGFFGRSKGSEATGVGDLLLDPAEPDAEICARLRGWCMNPSEPGA